MTRRLLIAAAVEDRGLAARALMTAINGERAPRLAEYLAAVALTTALELVIADQSLRARWAS